MYNIETEKALLGAILIDDRQLDVVLEHINTPEAFYKELHQKIFSVILELKNKNQMPDLVTVADRFPEAVDYIASLASSVVTSAHAENYARQIADRYLRRKLFRACQDGAKIATDEELTAIEAAAEIDSLILKAGKTNNIKNANLEILVMQRYNKYLEDVQKGTHFEGLQTGFKDLDNLIDGFGLGENIILAARPSMGKTALALNIALNVAGKGIPVMFFTLEQSKERLTDRLMAMKAGISAKRMRLRLLYEAEMERLETAYNELTELPIKIFEGSMNTSQIRSALARQKGKYLAVIDFLTLLTDLPTLTAHERYGTIAKKIQNMALEFNVPILTLAQLSRKVEERQNKRPILSDLRESGNIEEAADKVLFIYRDEYYNANTEKKGIAEIICAKNRDGEIGTEELVWRPEVLRFGNLSRRQEEN